MSSNITNPAPRLNKDGSPNKHYVDMLEEDKPIAGQKFACVSFVSPEQIIKNREVVLGLLDHTPWYMPSSSSRWCCLWVWSGWVLLLLGVCFK